MIAPIKAPLPAFSTALGQLYHGDCLDVLRALPPNSVDLVFADPPFNLGKSYPSKVADDLPDQEYLAWSKQWITHCIPLLKDGGSFFLYNLPKWNVPLGTFLSEQCQLVFRNWIAIEIKFSLPIQGRLYPSHYSLLYYCKGKRPNAFHPDRLPMEVCRHCSNEIRDYGGYKSKMNAAGVNLSDVWSDIPPVRHKKYKRRTTANELSIKLMDRVIEMASNPGDMVLDPFGGAGTTYAAAEIKKRNWIGVELGPIADIVDRLQPGPLAQDEAIIRDYRIETNQLFPPSTTAKRKAKGLWTPDDFDKSTGKPKHQKVRQYNLTLAQ